MRPVTILLAWILVAAPGLGLVLVSFRPGTLSPAGRVALVVPFGYAAVGLVSLVLALIHGLSAPTFLAVWTAGTAAVWWMALRRHSLREHLAEWRREAAAERVPYLLGLCVVLGFAVVRLTYSPLLNLQPGYYTSFRYWADGLEMADAHRVPELSLQWGTLLPYTVSKAALNAFHASASFVLGRGPLAPMGALLLVVSVALALAAFWLALELGLRRAAPLLPLLLFANPVARADEMTADLAGYRAENWGRLLAFAGMAMAVRAFRSDRPRWLSRDAAVAGALFGVGAGTHLVPLAVAVAFLGCYGLVRSLFFWCGRSLACRGIVVGAVGGLVATFTLFAPTGDVGFGGVFDRPAYEDVTRALGLPESFDPTRFVATGEVEQPPLGGADGFYDAPSRTYATYERYAGLGAVGPRAPWLLPAVGILALALVFVSGEREVKVTAGGSVLLGAVLLGTALVFSYRFDLYVLARFGERRLFDYAWVPVALLACCVAETALARLAGRERSWATIAVVAVAAVALAHDVADRDRLAFLSSGLQPLSWIERNVPCDGRVLADRRTLASFEVFTRHAGVIEGMGPHLRPDVLSTSIRETLLARDFFLHPSPEYLEEHGVAVVVVTSQGQGLGGVQRLVADGRAVLDGAPFLRVATASPSVTVYEVVGVDPPPGGAPDVRTQPGYLCG